MAVLEPGHSESSEHLVAELEELRRRAAEREQQLERYAADVRETYKQERERARELRRSYIATVRALTNAVEARDASTGKHAERVAAYGLELARVVDVKLAAEPHTEFGFLLHDIGKVAVPDAILHKPEPLSPEEAALMRRHTVVGWEILRDIDFLSEAKAVVRHHHERWDGRGYPDGLAGEDIPLAARVFAVADTFDAITSERPYKPALPFAEARRIIAAGSGTQFDPRAVAALEQLDDAGLDALRREIG